jgi:hypothetical protein
MGIGLDEIEIGKEKNLGWENTLRVVIRERNCDKKGLYRYSNSDFRKKSAYSY